MTAQLIPASRLDRLRAWAPEAALAILVLALGSAEILNDPADRISASSSAGSRPAAVLVLLLALASVSLARRAPAFALSLAWLDLALHLLASVAFLYVEIAFVVVLFGAARWGNWRTVVFGGLSVPTMVAVVGYRYLTGSVSDLLPPLLDPYRLRDAIDRFGPTVLAGAVAVGLLVLGVGWLAGLALRFADRARSSRVSQVAAEDTAERARQASEQAHEIADLREGQARLARDVHDVVGHSLAVILAQAESAQYLDDVDTERLKATMATIATSARSSLQDVRQVLGADRSRSRVGADPGEPVRRGLDTLIDGVRSSGHEIVSRELGARRPMPPELEVVAYRVLQEMLTNAIKHGARGEPVFVERLWPDGPGELGPAGAADGPGSPGELRIEVRNGVAAATGAVGWSEGAGRAEETRPMWAVPAAPPGPQTPGVDGAPGSGQGLSGMRRRLEAAGGRLDVRRREVGDTDPLALEARAGTTFTVTAWVPVRTVSP